MLYATTRNSQETFTAHWAMTGDRAPDGGFFVPYRQPYFEKSHLDDFLSMSFLEVTAEVLNVIFGTKLTHWDLLFSGGSSPVRMERIDRRTFSGERWRNTGWTFSSYARQIMKLISGEEGDLSIWGEIGVSAAVLFSMVMELRKAEILKPDETITVAAAAEDPKIAVSCLYAKAWGLPIGHVVCGCLESRGLWSLIHDGQMQTDFLEPDSKTVDGLEMLLNAEASQAEVGRFLYNVKRGRAYVLQEPLKKKFHGDLSAAVIGGRRILETLPGIYQTHGCIPGVDGALAYAALLDHRAVTGSGNLGLILSDRSPALDGEIVSQSLGMDPETLMKTLGRS